MTLLIKRCLGSFTVPCALLAATVGLLLTAQAQMTRNNSGGWGTHDAYNSFFNAKAIETVQGTVTGIESIVPMQGMLEGIALTLETASRAVTTVHAGPRWFMERREVRFVPGEPVTVSGAGALIGGKKVLLAAEISFASGAVLHMRNKNGAPAWRRFVPPRKAFMK